MNPRTALVVVDVQNDFCEGGSLPVKGGGEVARRISRHLAASGDRYATVVAARDWHENPGDHFSANPDFVRSWPPHCVAGTKGAEFHPDLDLLPIRVVFSKGRTTAAYSGFEGRSPEGVTLAGYLRAERIERVEIAGLATDYCVRATALDAVKEGFATVVLEDLTAGVSPETSRRAVEDMRRAGVAFEDSGRPGP